MSHRPNLLSFALVLAMMAPAGVALAQGGAGTGNPPATDTGAAIASPPVTGQSSAPAAPAAVQGTAEQPAETRKGLAKPAADGVTTKIVPAKPCSVAAHETDGTTTCVGLPAK